MSEIKLKPCPFCGSKAELRYNKDGFAYILCANDGCYARTDGCLNENEASRLWNTRKPMERIVERLEKRKKQLEELYKSGYGTTLEQLQCNDFLITTKNDIRIVKEVGGIE